MSTQQKEDSGRHPLSEVDADLMDYARAANDGWAVEVELTYGKCYARRLSDAVIDVSDDPIDVVIVGTGGGFVGRREKSYQSLQRLLENRTPEDPTVRRGPLDMFPDRYQGGRP